MQRTLEQFTILLAAMLCLSTACRGAPILQQESRILLPDVEGRIDHLSADVEGRRLFVAALGHGTVEVMNVDTRERLQSLTRFSEPQGVLFVPASRRLIVTDAQANHATIFDALNFAPAARVALPEDSDNVRDESDGDLVWIGTGSGRSSALVAIKPESGRVMTKIPLRGHPESFQLEQSGQRIFVNVPAAHVVQVVDRRRGTVIGNWDVAAAANFPMALAERLQRLFVATRSPARLIVYDTLSGRPVTSFPVVGDADDIFYDEAAERLYVSGGEGLLQVFRQETADRYTLLETVPTRPGARTSLFVPEWHKLLVALPRRGQEAAEIRV
ncbi:MAG: hypothetical protein AB7P22_18750, partial [Vicinamibacterales bacterium]